MAKNLILVPAAIISIVLIVAAIIQTARMEKVYQANPDLRPAPVVNARPDYENMTPAKKCELVHDLLKDRKVSSLTVSESEALEGCRLLGL